MKILLIAIFSMMLHASDEADEPGLCEVGLALRDAGTAVMYAHGSRSDVAKEINLRLRALAQRLGPLRASVPVIENTGYGTLHVFVTVEAVRPPRGGPDGPFPND